MADSEATTQSVHIEKKNTKTKEKKQRKNFKWEEPLTDELITCLLAYKAEMAFKCKDFDSDKPKIYTKIRKSLAKLHPEIFGPVETTDEFPDNLSKEEIKESIKAEKELINKGRSRVIEKIKEIRQNFSKAVVSGTRSGSGKIVYEHYDKLADLWGGSANTEPLPYGISGDCLIPSSTSTDKTESVESVPCDGVLPDNKDDSTSADDSILSSESASGSANTDRKRKSEKVAHLVDNKRKRLQKNLSSAQRDRILIEEAKDDAMFRKEMAEAIKESTKCFSESVNTLGASMVQMTTSIGRSIEVLAQALVMPSPTPTHLPQHNFGYYNSPQEHGYYTNMMLNKDNDKNN